jgi:epidermal growth factor receptor substrate 15
MFLIQSCMANPSLNLPATLPAGTYEQASGGRPPASPVARQNTGGASPVRPQYTGGAPGSGILQPQRTGQSVSGPASTPRRPPPSKISTPTSFTPNRQTSLPSWDVNSESKAKSDRFFTQLDTQNKGVIEGDVAVPFMLQSQLDEGVLATIWWV